MAPKLKTKTDLQEILEMLSAFENKDFSQRMGTTDDPSLKLIFEKLNTVAKALAAKNHQAEELLKNKLADQPELSQLFFEGASLGLNLCRMDGTWVESNPAFFQMIGYTREEANSGLTYWKLTPRKYDEMEKIQLECLARENRYGPYEKEFIRKDGTLVPVRLNGFIIEKNGEKFIWSIIEDLSKVYQLEDELKQNIKALERQSIFLNAIVESIPAAVFLKDARDNFRITLWNKAAEEIFEIPRSVVLGKTTHDLWPKDLADLYQVADTKVCREGVPVNIPEEPAETKNRGKIFLHTRKVPLRIDQDASYLLAVCDDITEQKKIAAALELERTKALSASKLATLGEMSAGIAHEINNPLAIISALAERLPLFSNDPEKLAAKVATILKSCGRIAKIVSGLKKFSRTGNSVQYTPRSLHAIAKEAVLLTEAKSQRHATPITLDGQSEALINCDEVEIEQVLINLIINAIDAVKNRPEKWVKISIYEEDSSLFLLMTDSGPGIPEAVRHKLFQPFFTTKQIGEGTGLGLSITKGILDEHQATITVVAASPHTCFRIQFPKFLTGKAAA